MALKLSVGEASDLRNGAQLNDVRNNMGHEQGVNTQKWMALTQKKLLRTKIAITLFVIEPQSSQTLKIMRKTCLRHLNQIPCQKIIGLDAIIIKIRIEMTNLSFFNPSALQLLHAEQST